MSRIGVLAVQGAFREHEDVLSDLGAEWFEIRKRSDLDKTPDGIVLPGGESTVMGKLTRDLGMFDRIRDLISSGVPVLGTCAGMILLAEGVDGGITHFATLPITVKRNAYGRQLGSFSARGDFRGTEIPLEFIRAPKVEYCGEGVVPLCTYDGYPVAVAYGNQVACSFHPELTSDRTVHRYFLGLI